LEQLSQVRPFTTDEKKEVQKQRRLIKNRESAQISRLRKKSYIDDLQAQINKMTAANAQLTNQNKKLKEENAQLREGLSVLADQVGSTNPTIKKLLSTGMGAINVGGKASKQKPFAVAMAVLLTVGFVMNFFPGVADEVHRSSSDEIPQVLPKHYLSNSNPNRHLLAVSDPPEMFVPARSSEIPYNSPPQVPGQDSPAFVNTSFSWLIPEVRELHRADKATLSAGNPVTLGLVLPRSAFTNRTEDSATAMDVTCEVKSVGRSSLMFPNSAEVQPLRSSIGVHN